MYTFKTHGHKNALQENFKNVKTQWSSPLRTRKELPIEEEEVRIGVGDEVEETKLKGSDDGVL